MIFIHHFCVFKSVQRCLFASGAVLTVKVQCDGRIAFAQLVLGRHLVFTGILNGNVFDFKGGVVFLAVFVDRKLRKRRLKVFSRALGDFDSISRKLVHVS